MRELVTPGELLFERPVRMEYTFIDNNRTYAKVVGLFEKERATLIPLEGIWTPRIDDTVVGTVVKGRNSVYEIDLSYFKRSILIGGMHETELTPGQVIQAQIKDIEDYRTLILFRHRVLSGGVLIEIKPAKVPRLIGRNNTMVNQISELTGTTIVVGMNGVVWLRGGDVGLATEAVLKVETEAHMQGLTERVREMLQQETKR